MIAAATNFSFAPVSQDRVGRAPSFHAILTYLYFYRYKCTSFTVSIVNLNENLGSFSNIFLITVQAFFS